MEWFLYNEIIIYHNIYASKQSSAANDFFLMSEIAFESHEPLT